MKKIESLKEIQNIELEILIAFDEFCRVNNLIYSLSGGTLLGAIRHKAFIPWDDDIDVMMPRTEYNKLLRLVEKSMRISTNYKVCIPRITTNYIYPFIKIVDDRTCLIEDYNKERKYDIGVYIDVFPLDYGYDKLEDSYSLVDLQMKYNNQVSRFAGKKHNNKIISVLKKIYCNLFIMLGKDLNYWIEKANNFPILDKCQYMGNFIYPASRANFYRTEWLNGVIDVEFEGHNFKAYKEYDEILTHLYGDYMTLPPERSRAGHNFTAFWL